MHWLAAGSFWDSIRGVAISLGARVRWLALDLGLWLSCQEWSFTLSLSTFESQGGGFNGDCGTTDLSGYPTLNFVLVMSVTKCFKRR